MFNSEAQFLLDGVRLGLQVTFGQLEPGARSRLISAFERSGWLAEAPVGDRVRLTVPFPAGGVEGRLQGALFLRETDAGGGRATLSIGNASEVRLNALELLRAELGEEACGPAGLDGKRNVVGATAGRCAELLARQLEFFRAAVDGLVAGIVDGLGGDVGDVTEERLWVRGAEVTADLDEPEAVARVRALQRAALPGSAGVISDSYRVSSGSVEGAPVVRWFRQRGGPVAKVYAKREDLVRAEVGFPKRAPLKRASAGDAEVGGEEAVRLLRDFTGIVAPLLGEVLGHVGSAAAPLRSFAQLVLDLAPLALLAEGRTDGPGRRPSDAARRVAADALQALLTVGSFSAPGLRINSAPWAVLRLLSEEGGPLVRWPGSNVYTVRTFG